MRESGKLYAMTFIIAFIILNFGTGINAQELKTSTENTNNKSGEQIRWQVISSGGTRGNSANFVLGGTAGQTAVGQGGSDNFGISHGFWQETDITACNCEPGDANGNLVINILDITYLINYLYKGGPAPIPYEICSGDPNANCAVNILDITYLINFLYKGGPLPMDCDTWTASCGGL